MRILVLPGTYDCANLGDLAMLEVALRRLQALWPSAAFHVLTHTPEVLAAHCPGVHPVPLRGRNRWLRARALPRLLFPGLPAAAYRHFPMRLARIPRTALWLWPGQLRLVRPFVQALFNADFFVMAGCGGLTDAFVHNALRILDTFDAARRGGIPTAMLSQGIGPASDPSLRHAAAAVLPGLGRLFIREARASLPLLHTLGVQDDAIRLTGDDALELAHQHRAEHLGSGLGFNLRIARYSGLALAAAERLRDVLASQTHPLGTRLIGLPVLCGTDSSDIVTLQRLLGPCAAASDLGASVRTTADLARRVARCRVVVTGSYHGAVFALAQGIPAVCIAPSSYYQDKFHGLVDQFPEGCRVLDTVAPSFPDTLAASIHQFWLNADRLRPSLLSVAEKLIRSGVDAYAELVNLVDSTPVGATRRQNPYSATRA